LELAEIKERYKGMPMWGRMLLASVLGVLPALFFYVQEGEALQLALDEVRSDEALWRTKFDKARGQKAMLPQLEEKLAFTEDQLKKAQQSLPETFAVDDLLQKTATAAKETGVELRAFVPDKEILGGSAVKYKEMPIKVEAWGNFAQVASFYDRLVHLDHILHLRNIDLATQVRMPGDGVRMSHMSKETAREDLYVRAQAQVVAYRSLRDGESVDPAKPDAQKPGNTAASSAIAPLLSLPKVPDEGGT